MLMTWNAPLLYVGDKCGLVSPKYSICDCYIAFVCVDSVTIISIHLKE